MWFDVIPYKVLISDSSVANPTLTHCVKFSSPAVYAKFEKVSLVRA